ncbi:MAG: hypothetical protein FJ095_13470 [Deltaproteobacteria bacterium]|nr:hypothetical protein [Deltaproteobacteria bacterium]
MRRMAWWLGAWGVTVVGAVGGTSCSSEPPVEQCFLDGDEDGNGLSDCEDPTCWRANVECSEICDDQPNDEDADGVAGCADSDCWTPDSGCKELCTGGIDEDGDKASDCADSDCWTTEAGCKEVCTGAGDEDADGQVDCADPDCWTPGTSCMEVCVGGDDEDADGQVDCFDDQCKGTLECKELCIGGKDEDVDGLADCDDPDCKGDTACVPTFEAEVKPILQKHCAGQACHVAGIGAGGLVVTNYADMMKDSLYCAGQKKGWCVHFRVNEGSMPKECPGCVKPNEVATLKAWVDGGMLP